MHVAILDNIRSAHNVGAIFRTADALGISKIYLVGYTPKPIDRFGRPAKEIVKTALGAEKTIPWEASTSLPRLISKLKKDGFTIIALEQAENSTDYKKIRLTKKTALILGNEVTGIPPRLQKQCDKIVHLPMLGVKNSLNVSVAFGAIAYYIWAKDNEKIKIIKNSPWQNKKPMLQSSIP